MGIYAIKPQFQHSLRKLETFCVRRSVHPDILTLAALALSACAGLAFALSGHHREFLLLAPLFAATRTLDGMVANASGKARAWGEVLNEFSDRAADAFVFGGFAFSGLVSVHLVWLTVLLAVLSDDLGVLSKAAGGPRQYGGIIGKADRMVLLAVAAPLAYFAGGWALSLMFAICLSGGLVTIVQRGVKTHADL